MGKREFDTGGGWRPPFRELALAANAATVSLIVGGWTPLAGDGANPLMALVVVALIVLGVACFLDLLLKWEPARFLTTLWSLAVSVCVGGGIGIFNAAKPPSYVTMIVLLGGGVVVCLTAFPMSRVMSPVTEGSPGSQVTNKDQIDPQPQDLDPKSPHHPVQVPHNQHPAGQ